MIFIAKTKNINLLLFALKLIDFIDKLSIRMITCLFPIIEVFLNKKIIFNDR